MPETPTTELPPRYAAADVQAEVAAVWDAENLFHAEPTDPGEPFSVVIPPPNVTAALHLGHALNNTVQDILVRRARMQGKNAVWIPGTDHAGIATQAVVEKRLQQSEGKRRTDYTREQFVARVQSWKDEYEQTILGQLKAMGCSCDFARTAFTMDAPRAKAVREVFFRLFKDGLIYRGKRLVNWDPVTQTALADDEVENEEIDGHFYYLKYPLTQSRDREGAPGDAAVETGPLPMDAGEAETATDDPRARSLPDGRGSAPMTQGRDREGALADAAGETALSSPDAGEAEAAVDDPRSRSLPHGRGSESYIVVATTRPETMLGDTAVAINPRDPRAASLRGKFVKLPLVDRLIPIVEDDYVVMPTDDDPKAKFATGFLKVTPAHDPNDWDIGQRHNLEVINVMAPDASISDAHGWTPETDAARRFVGQSREDARRSVVQWFKDHGLLEEIKPYRHSVGHSYRSHVPVEPYLSDQWYVAVQKPIPWMPDSGVVEGTTVPANSLAGLALTALTQSRDRQGAPGGAAEEAGPSSTDTREDEAMNSAPQARPLPDGRGSASAPLAYFITFTTHGTRLHGNPDGAIDPKHNRFGDPIPLGNDDVERSAAGRMTQDAVALDERGRAAVQAAIVEVCRHRGWSLPALHVRTTHVHAVVSADAEPERVMNDFKSYATRRLRSDGLAGPEAKVWTRHGSTRYVWHDKSLDAAIDYVVNGQGIALTPAPTQSRDRKGAPGNAANQQSAASSPTLTLNPDREGASGGVSGQTAVAPDENARSLPDGRGSASGVPADATFCFVPDRYAKTFHDWNAALRDWCISRQLWWGHRIPVWTKAAGAASASFLDDARSAKGQTAILNASGIELIHDGDEVIGCARGLVDLDGGEGTNAVTLAVKGDPIVTALEEGGYVHDPDVLDTWFSSALWPMSTLGWPDRTPALSEWNPTSVLCTAREIITLWVSRMVMFNRYLLAHPDESTPSRDRQGAPGDAAGETASASADTGEDGAAASDAQARTLPHGRGSGGNVPFKTVFIHAMIQDGFGQKMSKSLGNGVDPLDIIASHGADAMRFTLAGMTTHTQDVRLPVEVVDPHTGEPFTPETFVNSSGYTVFKPVQTHQGKKSVSSYGLASGEATPTPDVPAARNTSNKFDAGRNFCNKLWNAGRFVIANLQDAKGPSTQSRDRQGAPGDAAEATASLPTEPMTRSRDRQGAPGDAAEKAGSLPVDTRETQAATSDPEARSLPHGRGSVSAFPVDEQAWSVVDRWILSRLARTVEAANKALDEYRFDRYATACYDFFWRDFCDWYVEAAKPAMKGQNAAQTAHVLATCLDVSLRLMHPMIPFATERLWWALNEAMPERGIPNRFGCPPSERCMVAAWPGYDGRMDSLTSQGAERVVTRLQEITQAIRTIRTENKVDPRKVMPVTIRHPADVGHLIDANKATLELWATCEVISSGPDAAEPEHAAKATAAGCEIYVSGVVDPAAEAGRLARERAELEKKVKTLTGRLSNKGYTDKAPPHLVQQTRDELASAEAALAAL